MGVTAPEVARARRVLPLLAWVERRTTVPARTRLRRFDVLGSVTRRRGPLDATLPQVVTRRTEDDALGTVSGVTTAQVVRVGKFDVERIPRALAFYGGARPASVRIQGAQAAGRSGVGQAVAARQLVARHAPALAPPMFDHGRVARGRIAFLTEGLVDGRHPFAPERLAPALPDLLDKLHQLHVGVGIRGEPLSQVMHTDLLGRWGTFADTWELAASLRRAVAALIARDDALQLSLSHGDLVASNIVVDGERAVLVDWEHARGGPVAADLAKLERLVHDPQTPTRSYGRLAGDAAPTGAYALPEQVALAHAQMLTWFPSRRKKAARAGRLEALEADTRWRIDRIHDLLVAD